jgi:hypothetical protein
MLEASKTGLISATNTAPTWSLHRSGVAMSTPGMFRTRFTLDLENHDLGAVADVCTDALSTFHEIAATAKYDTEAFGPFEVEEPTNRSP